MGSGCVQDTIAHNSEKREKVYYIGRTKKRVVCLIMYKCGARENLLIKNLHTNGVSFSSPESIHVI